MKPSPKQLLFSECKRILSERVRAIQEEINSASDDANSESKSTAGDKHETGRAMAHLEMEKNSGRLAEALNDLELLGKMESVLPSETIRAGSLVKTDIGNFYIAVAAGRINISGEMIFAISPASPIGRKLIGKRKGDVFDNNEHPVKIIDVL